MDFELEEQQYEDYKKIKKMLSVLKGSKAIRKMIKEKKPAYFFCGHVHGSFGFKK